MSNVAATEEKNAVVAGDKVAQYADDDLDDLSSTLILDDEHWGPAVVQRPPTDIPMPVNWRIKRSTDGQTHKIVS